MKKPKTIFVLLGKSGAGKSTIINELMSRYGVPRIHTTTTRPQRNKGDTEYNFTSVDAFLEDCKIGRYIAVRRYHALVDGSGELKPYYYGVDKRELDNGGLLITDFGGYKELVERKIPVVGIYLDSDYETRLQRSENRPGFIVDEFMRRCADDDAQFTDDQIEQMARFGDAPLYILQNNVDTNLRELIKTITYIINNHI
jgi:guanylate kinase